MEKIYEKADDQHVRAVVAFARTYGDSKHELYASSDFTKYLDFDDVSDAFDKNMLNIVKYENGVPNVFKPVYRIGQYYYTVEMVSGEVAIVGWSIAVDPDAGDDSGDDSGDGGGK